MNRKWIVIISSAALVVGLGVAGASFGKSDDSEVSGGTIRLEKQVEADFPALAKITPDQAVQKALDAVPGTVLKTGLENENGFLVYSVEVVSADKTIMEVKVDAGSGKVLATERDEADEHEHRRCQEREEEEHEHGGDRDRED
jgi:uncharacterized membrane protein YkoI